VAGNPGRLLLVGGFAILPLVTVLVYALAREMNAFPFCFHGYNVGVCIAATKVTTARMANRQAGSS